MSRAFGALVDSFHGMHGYVDDDYDNHSADNHSATGTGCPYGFTHCADDSDLLFRNRCVAHPDMCRAKLFREMVYEPEEIDDCEPGYSYCPLVMDESIPENMYGGMCIQDGHFDACSDPQMDKTRWWHEHQARIGPLLVERNHKDKYFQPADDNNVWSQESIDVPFTNSGRAIRRRKSARNFQTTSSDPMQVYNSRKVDIQNYLENHVSRKTKLFRDFI